MKYDAMSHEINKKQKHSLFKILPQMEGLRE